MAEFDLIIAGGTVVTASDRTACDVAVKDGKVIQLGRARGLRATSVVWCMGRDN